MVESNKAEELVALLGHADAFAVDIYYEQCTQHEKESYHEKLCDAAHYHIFAAFALVFAGEIALHHILVEAVGGYGHEHTGDKLLPEVGTFLGIVEEEHPRAFMVGYRLDHALEVETKVGGYEEYAQDYGADKAETFQSVGPDKSFYTSLHRIQPYQRYRHDYIKYERHAQRTEYQQLQHRAYHKKAYGGAKHFRYKKRTMLRYGNCRCRNVPQDSRKSIACSCGRTVAQAQMQSAHSPQ